MSIVKWSVGNFSDKPERREYDKETAHFYIYSSGRMNRARRDAKVSLYSKYFDSEADAIAFIANRSAAKIRSRQIDQIRLHAVELLEAAERYLDFRHTGDIGMSHEFSGVHPQTQLKAVIAKAKGEA
jgi:hypothetical protein